MEKMTVERLKSQAGESPMKAGIDVQLVSRVEKQTRNGKPFLEFTFADSTGSFALKAWSDSDLFRAAGELRDGAVFRLTGLWTQNQYGLDVRDLRWEALSGDELEAFFAGDPETREKQQGDWETIVALCGTVADPRLAALCRRFLDAMGERFRRSAAARKNHHARRGGLVEHVAQMMRAADALCGVYDWLNRDLLVTGVLFHDCGKLWENTYPKRGFQQSVDLHGEMLGHIPLGIELANKLWRDVLESEEAENWKNLDPPSDTVRLHLLHLIASHHGQLDFGSPIVPRIPEAFALHYIDNLDAKLEMVRTSYANSAETAAGIYERSFPLPAGLIRPLPAFEMPEPEEASDETTGTTHQDDGVAE
jgi:3'-5' exoribonuclease